MPVRPLYSDLYSDKPQPSGKAPSQRASALHHPARNDSASSQTRIQMIRNSNLFSQ